MIRRILPDSLWVCAIVAGTSCAFSQQVPLKQSQKKYCSVAEVLWALGEEHDIYFTIEHAGRLVETQSMIWEFQLHYPALTVDCDYLQGDATDVNQELQTIQHDLPDLGYVIDSKNPKVIHVFDTAVNKQPDYPMSKVVGPFDFEGTEVELVQALNKAGIQIWFGIDVRKPPDGSGEPEASKTRVSIHAQSANVREILSSYLPADRKQRIMWVSGTLNSLPPPSTVGLHLGYRMNKDHHVYSR